MCTHPNIQPIEGTAKLWRFMHSFYSSLSQSPRKARLNLPLKVLLPLVLLEAPEGDEVEVPAQPQAGKRLQQHLKLAEERMIGLGTMPSLKL